MSPDVPPGSGDLNLTSDDVSTTLVTQNFPCLHFTLSPMDNSKQLECPPANPAHPSLCTLPKELLYPILSYTLDAKPDLRAVVRLRSVSRQFRAIINNLDFWLQPEYTITLNYGYKNLSKLRPFLQALFSDNHLTQCLGKKAIWTFSSAESVIEVIAFIPQFADVCQEIRLNQFSDQTLGQLQTVCLVLRRLEITTSYVNLTTVAEFANLEHFKLEDSWYYFGSLSTAPKLQGVVIERCTPNDSIDTTTAILPLASKDSLREFSLIYSSDEYAFISFNYATLNLFEHLTSLTISPLWKEGCEFLSTTEIQLTSFDSFLDFEPEVTLDEILSIFPSTSLRNLRTLRWRDDNFDTEECGKIILAITGLMSVEELQLRTVSFHPSWTHWFQEMKNLTRLTWTFHEICFIEGFAELDLLERRGRVQEGFEEVFRDVPEKPEINIEVE